MIAGYRQYLSEVDINLTPEGIAYFRNKKKAIFPKKSKELLKQLIKTSLAYKNKNGRDELIRRVHGSQWSIKFANQYDEVEGLFIK